MEKKAKKPRKRHGLNEKQELFSAEYLKNGGNAAEAVRAAGYNTKHAGDYGSKLLRKPEIQKTIQEKRSALAEKTGFDLVKAAELFSLLIEESRAKGQMTAAVNAAEKLAKLHRYMDERIEVDVTTVDITAALTEAATRTLRYLDENVVETELGNADPSPDEND